MIDPPPPTGAGMKAGGEGAHAKKRWSKPTIRFLDEMRGVDNGPKQPTSINNYEARSPFSQFGQYMPQSVAQSQHS